MEFPHLKDTKFPNFNNVDVYAFRNEFDYTRWGENTRIRLVNVLWDANYGDVVKFESDEARDAWFDSIDDKYDITLNTFIRIIPDGTIKLPIPYDVLSRYNYCYVDIPIATSEEHPIDYENDWGHRRWYFFIHEIEYRAPNTTLARVGIDVWTQYVNDMDFKYLMLERGHAPVAFSDVDDYLNNPMEHSEYLLAPDVTFDNAGIVKKADFVPIGNGEKYVCFASFCSEDDLRSLGTVTYNPNYSETGTPTYSNTSDRWGYQYQVNNYGIGTGYDFSNARTPATIGVSTNNKLANNITVYAIPAKEVYGSGTFFTDAMKYCPQFFNTVVACFIVSKEMLIFGNKYVVANHTLQVCNGSETQLFKDFTFKKEDFGFDTKYQRFAKLYTHPYSVVEVTDNAGSTREFYIEETSKLSLNLVTSVAFPFLNMRVWFDGVGGSGSTRYQWTELNGKNVEKSIANSRWFEWCLDWAIPTFTLYMDGKTAYQLSSFNKNIKNAREGALVSYENGVRSANTSYENSLADSNTANTNAHASNDTALSNANRSADTMKDNIDASANTSVTNQGIVNAGNRYNADVSILANTNIADMTNYYGGDKTGAVIARNIASEIVNNAKTISTTNLDAEQSNVASSNAMITSTGSAVTGLAGSIVAGGAAGSVVPGLGTVAGAGIGAVLGIIGQGINGIASVLGNNTAIEVSQTTAAILIQANATQREIETTISNRLELDDEQLRTYSTGQTNNSTDLQTDKNNAVAASTTTNSANTSKSNATRTQTTEKANALANNTTSNANSDRSKTTSQSNSGYTREAAVLNAKNSLEQTRNSALASIADAGNAAPKSIGSASGNFSVDYYENRGIQIKIKTQNKSAIRMTGDLFARYGYMLNQVWDMSSGFNLMKNFTYWKASSVWIDDRNASNINAQTSINAILTGGTTVWSNPDKIGKVSIYDN